MLDGSISNDKLTNNSLTITSGSGLSGGGSITLGGNINLDVNVDDNSIEINNDTIRVKNGGITNDMLSGSISNSKLTNSSITLGTTEISLGSSSTSLSGVESLEIDGSNGLKLKNGNSTSGFIDLYENSDNGENKVRVIGPSSIESNVTLTLPSVTGTLLSSNETGSITNNMLEGSITNSKLSNSSITINAGSGLSGGGVTNLGNSSTLDVNVDNSSIEINNDTSRVKNSGITNDMLSGSITNDKLTSSSISITTGSGLNSGGSVSLGENVTLEVSVDNSSIEINNDSLFSKLTGLQMTRALGIYNK